MDKYNIKRYEIHEKIINNVLRTFTNQLFLFRAQHDHEFVSCQGSDGEQPLLRAPKSPGTSKCTGMFAGIGRLLPPTADTKVMLDEALSGEREFAENAPLMPKVKSSKVISPGTTFTFVTFTFKPHNVRTGRV